MVYKQENDVFMRGNQCFILRNNNVQHSILHVIKLFHRKWFIKELENSIPLIGVFHFLLLPLQNRQIT